MVKAMIMSLFLNCLFSRAHASVGLNIPKMNLVAASGKVCHIYGWDAFPEDSLEVSVGVARVKRDMASHVQAMRNREQGGATSR